jgi:hypothetical protein
MTDLLQGHDHLHPGASKFGGSYRRMRDEIDAEDAQTKKRHESIIGGADAGNIISEKGSPNDIERASCILAACTLAAQVLIGSERLLDLTELVEERASILRVERCATLRERLSCPLNPP